MSLHLIVFKPHVEQQLHDVATRVRMRKIPADFGTVYDLRLSEGRCFSSSGASFVTRNIFACIWIDATIDRSTILALSSPPFGSARYGAASPCQSPPLLWHSQDHWAREIISTVPHAPQTAHHLWASVTDTTRAYISKYLCQLELSR